MNDIICPICFGKNFKEFRGRENAQCLSCGSLERHRLFKLFFVWLNPIRSRILLTSPSPLAKLDGFEKGLRVERLDKHDLGSLSKSFGVETLVFLENMVGFQEIETDCKRRVRALMEAGTLIAFTVHSGFEKKRRTELFDLFGQDIECNKFDPRAVFAEGVSDSFGLNLGTHRSGKGDIYFCSRCELR